MSNIRKLIQAALLITGAALMIVLMWLTGICIFAVLTYSDNNPIALPLGEVSEALTSTPEGYEFDGQALLERQELWAILIDPEGNVVWAYNKPSTVPEHYTINQVAAFSRWYLSDYPVQTRIRDDGLLVLGSPRGSVWKYTMEVSQQVFRPMLVWGGVMLALSLLCVIGLSGLLLSRWFRREQKRRDDARADWINGISHDIRTPLSLVMGYADELSQDAALPEKRRNQAGVILAQSELIRALVGDLNLTMRLDYAMQPLRLAEINPAALARQAGADLLNSGLGSGYTLTMELPENGGETLLADAALLQRALKNLLDNCVRHNAEGCEIILGLRREKKDWVFSVESRRPKPLLLPREENSQPTADGESAHGTGLKLVKQIAKVHGGRAEFRISGGAFLCQMYIPAGGTRRRHQNIEKI